jgi:hypothetical protein
MEQLNMNISKNTSYTTLALSLIVHGEAVRFNRGKSGVGRYDFKHMIDSNNNAIPYVSSQCFKKHWREALPYAPSLIIREKDAKGQEKNQAYTSGDPMTYVDDDLFGYMIAGAAGEVDVVEDEGGEALETPDDQDAKLSAITLSPDQLKADKTWLKLLKDDSKSLHVLVVNQLDEKSREEFDSTTENVNLSDSLRMAITKVLNNLLNDEAQDVFTETNFPELGKKTAKKYLDALRVKNELTVRETRFGLLKSFFAKGFEAKKKRETTKRTAPVRMHALVAFSGIKLAEDFQTFSRDVALTGKNSILNPNGVGIYSGWLKTRILIEAFRVGKFYIGGNLDILKDQVGENTVHSESNPYDRLNGTVEYLHLGEEERTQRIGAALQALGNIGNSQGPASGALHDGSLKPRAFIGAMMNCADSPFDSVWDDDGGIPRLNLTRLKGVLRDWEDLFSEKTIFIGIAPEMLPKEEVEEFGLRVNEVLKPLGFSALVDTPRLALKTMAAAVKI